MKENHFNRNIFLYYIYTIFKTYHFVAPIFILYFLSFKLNIIEATIVASTAFYLSWIIFEIPTGAWADLYGRKKIVVLAALFLLSGALFYSFGKTFLIFAIGAFLWGIGMALDSGAINALLYDSLISLKKEKDFKKIQGNALFYSNIFMAISYLLGAYFFILNSRIPFYGAAGSVLISLLTAVFFIEPPYKKSSSKGIKFLKRSTFFAIKHKPVIISLFFSLFTIGFFSIFLRNFAPLYLELTGLSVALFGIVFASSRLFSSLGAKLAYRLDSTNEKTIIVSILILFGIVFIVMSFVLNIASILLVFLIFFIVGASKPFIEDYLHKRISSDKRAFVFSIQQFGLNLFNAIFTVVLAYFIKILNLKFTILIIGLIIILGAMILLLTLKSNKVLNPKF